MGTVYGWLALHGPANASVVTASRFHLPGGRNPDRGKHLLDQRKHAIPGPYRIGARSGRRMFPAGGRAGPHRGPTAFRSAAVRRPHFLFRLSLALAADKFQHLLSGPAADACRSWSDSAFDPGV